MSTLTVRGVDERLHRELRSIARLTGLSVTKVAVALLAHAAGTPNPHIYLVTHAIRHQRKEAQQP